MHSWQNIHHTYTGNPYPVVQPPAAHKVWILDCRSCGTFITNRGMKVRSARVSLYMLIQYLLGRLTITPERRALLVGRVAHQLLRVHHQS